MDLLSWIGGFGVGMIVAGLLALWSYKSDIKNGYLTKHEIPFRQKESQ